MRFSAPFFIVATTFRLTVFMIGLVFRRSIGWNGQSRETHGVAWSKAVRELWPAWPPTWWP